MRFFVIKARHRRVGHVSTSQITAKNQEEANYRASRLYPSAEYVLLMVKEYK